MGACESFQKKMGACEDRCPSITLVNEISLKPDSNGAHHGGGRDDRDGSSEQALIEKLENAHLEEEEKEEEEEERPEENGDKLVGVQQEDKANVGAGEEGQEEEKEKDGEKEEKEEDGEKEERRQNGNGGHPYPLHPDAEDCTFYMKTGSCKFGMTCRFNHPMDRVNKIVDVDSEEQDVQGTDGAGKIECKYYTTPGGCKYGVNCRYSHSKEKTDDEPLELNFLGLPIRKGEKECPYYMRNGSCGYGVNCRFHHPDPTAATEEPKNLTASGRALQGGKSYDARNIAEFAPSMSLVPRSTSNSSSSENLPSYVPWMNSLPQGILEKPGYNQCQVPATVPDKTVNSWSSKPLTSPVRKAESLGHNQQLLQNEQFPERPGQPDCDYFMKTGFCKFESACRFNHPKRRLHNMPNGASHNLTKEASHLTHHHTQMVQMEEYPERPGELECSYFMKTGECKYKSACRFNHPKIRVPKSAASMYGMNGIPSRLAPIVSHEAKKLPDLYPSYLNQMAKPLKHYQQPTKVEGFPDRPGQPECEYFMRTGDCKYKSGCRFHHPISSRSRQVSTGSDSALNEKGLPVRHGAKTCRNYEQLGICRYGPRCPFDHPLNCNSLAIPEPAAPQSPPGNNAGSEDWGDGWVIG